MRKYLSLSPQNKAQVVCPIFNAKVKVASCVALREKVWRGEHVEVRRGCQACMASGKCPVAATVTRMAFAKGEIADSIGSYKEEVVEFDPLIMARIKPIIVDERVMDKLGVSPQEHDLIITANKRITVNDAYKAPVSNYGKSRRASTPRNTKAAPVQSQIDKIKQAAATGDLSAALVEG